MHAVAWIFLVVCLIGSLLGTFLPAIPGTALILIGALFHKFVYPNILNRWVIYTVALLTLLAWGVDFIGLLVGKRIGRASKYGLYGAMIGAIFGLAFPPIGFIAGPAIGAMLGELLVNRSMDESVRSGLGAGAGTAMSMILRVVINLTAMILVILDLFIK